MASGLVVVAYDYAAAQQHLRHNLTGLLVKPGDRSAFIQMADEASHHTQTEKGVRLLVREYAELIGWSSIYDRFEKITRQCLLDTIPASEVA